MVTKKIPLHNSDDHQKKETSKSSSKDWFFGKNVKNNQEGIFPRLCVQKLNTNHFWKQKVRIKYDHKQVAENELELVAGDIVTLKEVNDDPYWEAEHRGRIGIFPSDWAEIVSLSLAQELELSKWKESPIAPFEDSKDSKVPHETLNSSPSLKMKANTQHQITELLRFHLGDLTSIFQHTFTFTMFQKSESFLKNFQRTNDSTSGRKAEPSLPFHHQL